MKPSSITITLGALLVAAGAASGQTRTDLGAEVTAGVTDNATAEFTRVDHDPFGPTTRSAAVLAAAARIGFVTQRDGGSQELAFGVAMGRLSIDSDRAEMHKLRANFGLDQQVGSWTFAARAALRLDKLSAFEPEDFLGRVPFRGGATASAGAAASAAVDVATHVRLFNELHGQVQIVSTAAMALRDELGVQLSLGGRDAFELRGLAGLAKYDASISDGPYAADRVLGGAAGWRHELGAGWGTFASVGAATTRRDNRTFDFAMDPGVFVSVTPTATARLEHHSDHVELVAEAARRVVMDTLVHETYITSEGLLRAGWRGDAVTLVAQGGAAWLDPLAGGGPSVPVIRAGAELGWRFSPSLRGVARYDVERFDDEDGRILLRNVLTLGIEAGATAFAPSAELNRLTVR